jgi:hypothetical protein
MDFRALPPQRRQGIGRSHAGPDTHRRVRGNPSHGYGVTRLVGVTKPSARSTAAPSATTTPKNRRRAPPKPRHKSLPEPGQRDRGRHRAVRVRRVLILTASTSATAAIGAFRKKILRHPTTSTSHSRTGGPSADVSPPPPPISSHLGCGIEPVGSRDSVVHISAADPPVRPHRRGRPDRHFQRLTVSFKTGARGRRDIY